VTEHAEDRNLAAEERSQDAKRFVRQVRSATRRKYTPEEKIHIVLQGFRREVTDNELCRREGIKPANYYSWTKDFMEAGKQRLSRDTTRDATRQEIDDLKRESADLKVLVAELSLDLHRLKKTAMPTMGESRPGA
jgi:transposase